MSSYPSPDKRRTQVPDTDTLRKMKSQSNIEAIFILMIKLLLLDILKKMVFTQGIARRLVKAALHEAAKKREMRYADLKKIDRGVRRHFHDDITVIVLFLDSHLICRSSWRGPPVSIQGGGGGVTGNGNC